ncbi:MAG: hypothetical protein AAF734_00410 [Bacteroidota bacterium]
MGGGHENIDKNEEEQQDDVGHISDKWQAFEQKYRDVAKPLKPYAKEGLKEIYKQDPHQYYNLVNKQAADNEERAKKGQPKEKSLHDSPELKKLYPSHGFTKKEMVVSRTDKKGKMSFEVLPKEAEVTIAPSKEAGKFEISTVIKGKTYTTETDYKDIEHTPNSLDQIDPATRRKIDIHTTESFSISPEYDFDGTLKPPYYLHYNDIPEALHPFIVSTVVELSKESSTFGEDFRTVTVALNFNKIPKDIEKKLSDEQIATYKNQTLAFRFTNFKKGDKHIVLVENLGKATKTTQVKVDNNLAKFHQYHFTFHEPTDEEKKNAKKLEEAVEKFKKKNFSSQKEREKAFEELYELFEVSALPFSKEEKEVILTAVEKLPPSALLQIKGVTFRKEPYHLDATTNALGEDVLASYNYAGHNIYICSDITRESDNIFGDKEKSGFSNSAETDIVHELGHAVDYAPLKNASSSELRREEVKAHSGRFKRVRSLPAKDYETESKFDKLVAEELPHLSPYSRDSDQEAFAEVFTLYVTAPETLYLLSPKLYKYMEDHFPKY